MTTQISLFKLLPANKKNFLAKMLIHIIDKLLGIKQLDRLYQDNALSGLPKTVFAQRLIESLNINIEGSQTLLTNVPKTGPLVIASNHPFGGIEGVILAWLIEQVRPDIKIMANQGLKIFPELNDFFIFTNPLAVNAPQNAPSIRACLKHVKKNGALLIFPAGRVSYYHKDKKRIADHDWNRMLASIVQRANANYLPIYVNGKNSPLFYRLGRLYFRFRLLMLPRELINKRDTTISIQTGSVIANNAYNCQADLSLQTRLMRIQSYLLDKQYQRPWAKDPVTKLKALHAPISTQVILSEIHQLPAEHLLVQHKGLSVYFAYKKQIPNTVLEIARLRELVFRQHNEGSGEPIDTDKFDETYTHLFIVNMSSGAIIGAYRMGQTDRLLAAGQLDQLYLHRMFEFGVDFINRNQPCLEMGRSFLIPAYQRSFQGLYLLWRGIGAFVCLYPRYRTLYGTVSISKLYDPRSVALIQHAMVTPTNLVKPRVNFDYQLSPEVEEFCQLEDIKPHINTLLKGIESDGKDVPILLKHYQKLGATFHCLGIDRHFNDTPGLLLSVDLAKAPEKLLKLYLGEAWCTYTSHG